MNDYDVHKLINKIKPVKATPNMAKLLGKLYNALYNLGAGVDMDIYLDYGIEPECPYNVSHLYGDGHILIIRNINDLQAIDIWPERKGSAPNNVKIYTIYNKNVKFKTDFIAAHAILKGDTINNMEYFMVEVDGKLVTDDKELQNLLNSVETQSIEQWKNLISMGHEEQKLKGMFSRCLPLKNLFTKLGLDWKPTQEMINAIKDKPFTSNEYWKIPNNDKDKEKYFMKLYDPREEFYPGDSV